MYDASARSNRSRVRSRSSGASDLPARDLTGQETDAIVRGLGTLYTWNVWSPRLGVTTKLTSDGRTMLRASYGRFHQGVLTGELGPIHPGQTPITTMAFDLATGEHTRLVSVVDPKTNFRLDPETGAPRTDEYSVGVDRELGRGLSVAIAYIRKNGIAWTDTGGIYREETRTMADGRIVPVFVLTSGTASRPLVRVQGFSRRFSRNSWSSRRRSKLRWSPSLSARC
jgi:hypothetical protein